MELGIGYDGDFAEVAGAERNFIFCSYVSSTQSHGPRFVSCSHCRLAGQYRYCYIPVGPSGCVVQEW